CKRPHLSFMAVSFYPFEKTSSLLLLPMPAIFPVQAVISPFLTNSFHVSIFLVLTDPLTFRALISIVFVCAPRCHLHMISRKLIQQQQVRRASPTVFLLILNQLS